ncbi:MAG: DUF1489 domain-containing protein [Cypionkella sp.]|uniref:DUF1489 family protein n=1 Tax=Cypionkella sp. TaxID=2811411 RepID=UPI002ABB64B3|nr:DUF1489 domain-containing protein [Cypionkella sp.]MDZ4312331.1 DUF1489 domain-containing protein [Cypionkella sp.]
MLNILKLSVGTESVDDLAQWHRAHAHVWAPGTTEHVTRMWPKREDEILNGGSLYWVIKGMIQARQRLVGLAERRGQDGILRCALVLDAELIRTENALRRPFQGWRYLDPAESPRDLPKTRAQDDTLPPALAAALAEIGLR